ncbi:hypothetical protein [Acetivibrio saccincola]|uniref:Uncharacterized protein n=1 Tax=Acetivibrio saccincola TaxID=1677857 RepID=A0A2S8R8Q6_9FIRM|nr:hypothetical protein [Acetivibrio saccincola]PQQ66155.1 hypothetical protein B9R14_04885 [Acetivibrio saccincola]HOA96399.1 hypothetical protein [Acetivibrio saccincola]HQD29515.1 hypothetical protein [Acetivibrio saccincola]
MKSNIYADINKTVVSSLTKYKERRYFLNNCTSYIIQFLKQQTVLAMAVAAMLVTCIFVPLDAQYLNYFNWTTLATLYCTLIK